MWKYDTLNKEWSNILSSFNIRPRYNFAHTFFVLDSKPYFAVLGGKGQYNAGQFYDFYL